MTFYHFLRQQYAYSEDHPKDAWLFGAYMEGYQKHNRKQPPWFSKSIPNWPLVKYSDGAGEASKWDCLPVTQVEKICFSAKHRSKPDFFWIVTNSNTAPYHQKYFEEEESLLEWDPLNV